MEVANNKASINLIEALCDVVIQKQRLLRIIPSFRHLEIKVHITKQAFQVIYIKVFRIDIT